jgi:2-polyprenyl-3-methyl-5-hydroxy-6-metoxy-1,4-benzoquinol methylase
LENPFEAKLVDIANKSSLALMMSVGHRTGLFDVISELPPSTSEQIATKAKLSERYVREWLGAMVTGEIIDYDPSNALYSLDSKKAVMLTRSSESYNFAAQAQWIPVLAQVENEIVNCFKNGGGVPYSSYDRFHEVMAEESDQTTLRGIIESILPLVPNIKSKLENGINVMEVGCGSGRALNLIAKHFPNSNFTGYDISEEALKRAKSDSSKSNLSNINFEIKDLVTLQDSEKFDLILSFDVIHDQASPDKVLENISHAIKPGGVFLMQDIAGSSHLHKNLEHPLGPFLYTISCLHCMTVSLANNGAGLGAMWGKEKALQMLNDAGFGNVDVQNLPHDPVNYYYIARKN